MIQRVASCSCGGLMVACKGEPALVALCHCLACQKRTGSAFGVAAFFPREQVTTTGDASEYRRLSESGRAVDFRFCPTCGSTVYWEPEQRPELVAVALGAFADPAFPAPTRSVWQQHAHPWVKASHDGAET